MSAYAQIIPNTWKGIFAVDFTLKQTRLSSYQLSEILLKQNKSCLIAYDTRFMSNLFAQDIANIFEIQGVKVHLAAMPAPLPAIQLALSQQQIPYALVVTARNDPYWYNGLVILETALQPTLPLLTPPAVLNPIFAWPTFPPPLPKAAEAMLNLRGPYLEMLREKLDVNLIRRSPLTLFVDPMCGTTTGCVPLIIGDGSQTRAVEINRETDPLFSKLTPLPVGTDLARIKKLVRESDSHLGLAFSADGTALGVVDKAGNQLDQVEIALLLASYLARQYRQKGLIIVPQPLAGSPLATNLKGLSVWQESLGLQVEFSAEATDQIRCNLAQEQPTLLLGCTPEGEIVFGQGNRCPDALFAGMLIVEQVVRNGSNLRALLNDLHLALKGAA